MVHEYLSDQGLVDFSVASEVIAGFGRTVATAVEWESPDGIAVADLMHLNAAEIALLQGSEPPRPQAPLRVPGAAANLSISATNSGPFVAHSVREEPRLWDVTLLGSDASKLAWLSKTESVEGVAAVFVDVVRRLADLYADNDPTGYGRREILATRAMLWRGKIAVVLDERELGSVMEVRNALL